MHAIEEQTAREVLASLMAVPKQTAAKALAQLEPEDFPSWIHQHIFEALPRVDYPHHGDQGAVAVLVNSYLLEAGLYQDNDNGLRDEMNKLVGVTGHPELLPAYINEMLENRWRREVEDYLNRGLQHVWNSPKRDLEQALAGINRVREYHQRTTPVQALKPAQNAA